MHKIVFNALERGDILLVGDEVENAAVLERNLRARETVLRRIRNILDDILRLLVGDILCLPFSRHIAPDTRHLVLLLRFKRLSAGADKLITLSRRLHRELRREVGLARTVRAHDEKSRHRVLKAQSPTHLLREIFSRPISAETLTYLQPFVIAPCGIADKRLSDIPDRRLIAVTVRISGARLDLPHSERLERLTRLILAHVALRGERSDLRRARRLNQWITP